MKFTADAKVLKEAFNKTLSAIPQKNIMQILECFLLDIKKDTMIITGTDLKKGVRCKVAVTADAEISLAVPGKIITDLVDELEGSLSFDIETKDKGVRKIDILSSSGKYKISASPAEDFPETSFDIKGKWFEIDAELLHKALSFTDISISREDIRPAMSGLLIQLEKGNINFVGTDGHKLSFFSVKDFDKAEGEFIVPREGMVLVKKIAVEGKVSFCPAASQIVFKSGEDLIWVRLIGDKYPIYRGVIPTENDKFAEVDRERMQTIIKRLMLLETGIRTVPKVVFDFKKDECTVSLQCTESGNSGFEKLECKYSSEDLSIAFNAKYWKEILAVFDTEKILLSMNNPSKAIVIKESKGEENFILVMPIKIDG